MRYVFLFFSPIYFLFLCPSQYFAFLSISSQEKLNVITLARNVLLGGEADVFNKFKDINGNFKASLTEDVRGMLSLYEAAHLRVHGEIILDEALAFTMSHLETVATQLNSPLTAQVNRAINRPLRKSLPRLEARHYMAFYQQDPSHSEALLTFAKLDFNMLQKLHQRELSDILRYQLFQANYEL